MTVLRRAALALWLLTACSAPPSAQEQLVQTETDALAPLKQTYSGVVTGFDVPNDSTLVISIDANEYNGLDDDAAAALRKHVLETWRDVWRKQHPGEHAKLTVKLNDFIGRTWITETTRA